MMCMDICSNNIYKKLAECAFVRISNFNISNIPNIFVERIFSTKHFSVFGYKVVKHLTRWPLKELVKLTMLLKTGLRSFPQQLYLRRNDVTASQCFYAGDGLCVVARTADFLK